MDTLVLTAGYQPLARVSWKRAIRLWCLEKVEILESYGDRPMRSAHLKMETPAVVRCLRRHRVMHRGVKLSRANLHARDGGRCQYCTRPVAVSESTLDHVVPRSRGGLTHWENLVIACQPCNQRKGSLTPGEAGMGLCTAPRKPRSFQELLWFTHRWKAGMPELWRPYLPAVQGL